MLKTYPAVIALNGPPHSGKSHLVNTIKLLIPDAVAVYPSAVLYDIMQSRGVAPKGMKYDEFKKLPDSRDRLIFASQFYRSEDKFCYERRICDSEAYLRSRVVIIDNVGHSDCGNELKFYDDRSCASLLLRVDTPYNEIEPMKSRARRLKSLWAGDSRTPLEHGNMLTAYDSLQLTLLLRWLDGPLTREEAGPYNGIKQLWDRYYASDSSERTQLLSRRRDAGELGRLGKATSIQHVNV